MAREAATETDRESEGLRSGQGAVTGPLSNFDDNQPQATRDNTIVNTFQFIRKRGARASLFSF